MLSDVKHSTFTDMAQRQRARLITARSQDQNLLSVSFNSQFSELPRVTTHKSLYTGVAQRERAGLITPRSLVQTQPPVFSYSRALQKHVVQLDVKRSLVCRCSSAAERLNIRLLPFDSSWVRSGDGYPLITGRS